MSGALVFIDYTTKGSRWVSSNDPLPVTLVASTDTDPVVIAGVNGTGAATAANPLPVSQGALTAGVDRSGTATTTSGGLNVAANAARKSLVGQNLSSVNIGFNEVGGTAVIGAAGTYTVAPGLSFSISTPALVNFIAASGTAVVAMTET